MSQDPWDDWSDAWKASAPPPSVDLDAIERRIRRRVALRSAQIALDLAASALALGVSLWAISLGGAVRVAIGAAGLAFSLFGLFIILGGRHPSGAQADRSVVSALDREMIEVGADIRRSLGGLAMACGGTVFLGVCTAIFTMVGVLTPERRWLTVAGLAVIVGSALWSGWLLIRRRARLRRLAALRNELAGDGET